MYVKSLTASIACNATLSEAMQMGIGIKYGKMFLQIPTFATAAAVKIYGSFDGTTYRYLNHSPANSATVALIPVVYASGANGYVAGLEYYAPYMKFQVTGTVCVGTNFRVFAEIIH